MIGLNLAKSSLQGKESAKRRLDAGNLSHRIRSCSGQQGLTLTEMIVVIAIIGIITAISFNNLLDFQEHNRLNNEVQQLVSDLRQTQVRALAVEPQDVRDHHQHEALAYDIGYALEWKGEEDKYRTYFYQERGDKDSKPLPDYNYDDSDVPPGQRLEKDDEGFYLKEVELQDSEINSIRANNNDREIAIMAFERPRPGAWLYYKDDDGDYHKTDSITITLRSLGRRGYEQDIVVNKAGQISIE